MPVPTDLFEVEVFESAVVMLMEGDQNRHDFAQAQSDGSFSGF